MTPKPSGAYGRVYRCHACNEKLESHQALLGHLKVSHPIHRLVDVPTTTKPRSGKR
jgi:hypothetical protein